MMASLSENLLEITGMDAVALSPAAGAQGELCGILAIKQALEKNGEKILVQFDGIDAPELVQDSIKTQDCINDQKKAKKARKFVQDILSSAKEIGLIIKKEINEYELKAKVYADGLSVGQELLYKYLAVEGKGNWCK